MTFISYPYQPSGTDTRSIDGIMDDFDAVASAVNGSLEAENMAPGYWVIEQAVNILVPGEVRVPVGEVDIIPAFFVPKATGQTVKLLRVRDHIRSGTSVTYKIQRSTGGGAFADVPGATGILATTTANDTDFADVTLAADDRLQVVVTAVSGTPQNLAIAVVLEHSR